MHILQVNSSVRTHDSHSTQLANELTQLLLEAHPGSSLVVRDLTTNPHPAVDEATLGALFTPAEHRTPEQAARVAKDDALIGELMAADVVVMGAPMYNFGVPAQLKSWLDAVARAGVTFCYTEKGPVGLVHGKTAYVVSTRGGVHVGRGTDQVTPYLKTMLGFLGMTDVRFIYAEGLAMGPRCRVLGMSNARSQISRQVAVSQEV